MHNYGERWPEEKMDIPVIASFIIFFLFIFVVVKISEPRGGSGEPVKEQADENGEEIITESATGMLMISKTVELAPGHYTLYFTSDDTILGKSFSYQVIVQ